MVSKRLLGVTVVLTWLLVSGLSLTAVAEVVANDNIASGVVAGPAIPWTEQAMATSPKLESIAKDRLPTLSLSIAGAVDFDLAQSYGAVYLRGMQADITEDNAGNGNPDVPDDPDDGGWDWVTTAFSHSTGNSPPNIYGATAMGLYYTYIENGGVGFLLAMTDAADTMRNSSNIRSGSDLVFLMLYNDLPAVSGTSYEDSARAKYDARLTNYGGGTAQGFAEYIRDARAGQGYPNGIIAWDIGVWARVAAMLDVRFPGNGYDTDADAIAEVIYQDSYMDNPGHFDIVDDAGWDPTGADVNFWWYNLGITGLIDAFDAAGVHTSEIAGLVTLLLDGQAGHGGISDGYGANPGDEDWQATAYSMMTLGRLDQVTYQSQLNEMGYFLSATQDVSGAWVYSSGNHYPEIGGEATAGLFFTTNTTTYDLADAVVDDDFTSQADVDLYNDANGANFIWDYDAFATIAEAADAVDGSTVLVQAGTYYETLNITKPGLNIVGVDRATVIIDPTGLATNNAGIYVAADNVTLQSLTLQSTISSSLPRYGIKFGEVDLCTLEDVTATGAYRTGIDCLGTSNLTILNVSAIGNGGHGLALVDCNDVVVTDVSFSGNGWQNVSVATWGEHTPLGTSGIVFVGTNTFGDLFQLEMGDYNNPGVPPSGAAVITYSTNIIEGADVTVQSSDFEFALHGEQDDSPDQVRVWFFSTLTNAAIVPPLAPIGHWTGVGMFIESLTDGTQLYVTPGGTIQAAIDAADPGDWVNVSAGTYVENIDVNKRVTIVGAGSGYDPISNTIITQNPAGAGDTKIGVVQLTASGLSLVDPITFRDLRLDPDGMAGFSVGRFTEATGTSVSYIEMDNVAVVGNNVNPNTEQERGLYVDQTSTLSYLAMTNCSFDSLTYGWYLHKQVSADASTVEHLTIDFTTFNHNNHKGIYAEKLTDAIFHGCTVSENGFSDVGMPSYFVPWMAGIDINLKAGTYSNLIFEDCIVTDNALGGAKEGVGLTVKGRGTGNNPSGGYTTYPAWVSDVHVWGGTYTGNERGMRFGEPGKENASPTNVDISGADIHSNVQTYIGSDGSAYGDVINQMMAGIGVLAEENWWGTISYANILSQVSGEVDFDPWCSDDTHTYCTLTYPVTEVWVDDDWVGTLEGTLVDGHVFGYDAFGTVQDGVDNVQASTVYVAAGTYIEQVHITTNNLNLIGSGVGVTIIQSPVALTAFFVTPGPNNNYPVLFVDGVTGVTITNLTVDGHNEGDTNYRFSGIAFWNGDGSVIDAAVLNVMNSAFSGAQHGVGIYSYNDTGGPFAITLTNIVVDDFQKTAVALAGVGLTVDLDNVTCIGQGPTSITAQNGIQISSGAGGTVDNSSVVGVDYTGASYTASGMLVYSAEPVIATGVDIDQSQTSVYYQDASGIFDQGSITNPSGDGFIVYSFGAKSGGDRRAVAAPYDEALPAGGSKVPIAITISNSTLAGSSIPDSWGTYAYATSGAIDYTVTGCTVSGWSYAIVPYEAGAAVNAHINGNSITGCDFALGTSGTDPVLQDCEGNWYGVTDDAAVAALIDGNIDYAPWWGANYVGDPHTSSWDWHTDNSNGSTIADAIAMASAGDVIYVAGGTYPEGTQVLVDKNITVIGETAKSLVTIVPTANTSSSGDARGWFLVPTGVEFDMSNVTLDGAGFDIYQGIRHKGGGTLDNVDFQNIVYPGYGGVAVAAFGGTFVTISNSNFANIGRIGALLWTDGAFTGNTYTGKGDGDWLDYAIDMNAGAVVDITDNTISGNTGVASSDGSTSAGFLVTTFSGPGTTGNFEGNIVSGCTAGITVGFDAADASIVTVTNGNTFVNNATGISTTASSTIVLTVYGNVFSNTVNADDDGGGTWDDGAGVGNCWSDFDANAGYPTYYLVGGDAAAVDNYPTVDCGVDMSPDDIVYLCDGNFSIDVGIGGIVSGLEAANYAIAYPANLVVASVTPTLLNYTVFYNVNNHATGLDTLFVQLAVNSGSAAGPITLFTIEMNGAGSFCDGTTLEMVSVDLRDGSTLPFSIPASVASPVFLSSDCEDPTFTINSPVGGGFYNVAPVLDFAVGDNCDIDAIYYQIDGCDAGSWTPIVTAFDGTSYADAAWTIPGFAGMSEAEHCVRFKVTDDFGRGNDDSCSSAFCFTKDVTAPQAPTNLVATPGHNKVNLTWNNATSDFDHTVVVRTDWYAGGHGYPEYENINPEGPYPADINDGDLTTSSTAESFVDTDDLSNTTRDIYHYAAFTVDAAGNTSASAGSEARSTSYWLGDISDGTPGSFDGYVYFQDLTKFALGYRTADGDPGFWNQSDFGPTIGDAKGIPVPDDSVQFEDLVIFAINYDAVDPTMKVVPLLPVYETGGLLALDLIGEQVEDQFIYTLRLKSNTGDLKALHAVLQLPDESPIGGFTVSPELSGSEVPLFTDARQIGSQFVFDMALLGEGMTIGGSGDLITISIPAAGFGSTIELVEGQMRDLANEDLVVELRNSAAKILPKSYALYQNYPNPFNPSTDIVFDLPKSGEVRIDVYNTLGRLVTTLVNEKLDAGQHTLTWTGTNSRGQRVASGIYLYRISSGDFSKTKKMILLK